MGSFVFFGYAADKQSDRQKTPNALPTLTGIVGVDNNNKHYGVKLLSASILFIYSVS